MATLTWLAIHYTKRHYTGKVAVDTVLSTTMQILMHVIAMSPV